jgi:hypothetical protein
MKDVIDAVAEAWASIDGKLELYQKDEASRLLDKKGVPLGYFEGYRADARALIERIKYRGYNLTGKYRMRFKA